MKNQNKPINKEDVCPKCHRTHHMFNLAPSYKTVKFAICGQAYFIKKGE